MSNFEKQIFEKYPFLSLVEYGGSELIGIIQNYDDTVMSLYDYSKLKTTTEKQKYLELGEIWWWESNRLIPINIFIKQDWEPFRYTLVNLNVKDSNIAHGPSVNIQDLSKKRTKRRNIQLVKRVK
jgi:hypothetical protein